MKQAIVAGVLILLSIPGVARGQGVRPLSIPEAESRLAPPAVTKPSDTKPTGGGKGTESDKCDVFLFTNPPAADPTYVIRRHDERYKKSGDLATFNDPELRWVYGFSVNLKSFFRSDGVAGAAAKPNTFDFGFAVEREIARGSGLKIPSNARYVIRGEMNLLRAFTGAKPS